MTNVHSAVRLWNIGTVGVSRKHRPRKRRPQTADLENADLENTDLENADLENADLENVRSFIKCMGERKFKTAHAGDNHVNRYVDPKSRKWSGWSFAARKPLN